MLSVIGQRTWVHVADRAPDAGGRPETCHRTCEPGRSSVWGGNHPRDAHVSQVGGVALAPQHVGQLDVAVDVVVLVHPQHCGRDLPRKT
jgi:hypothetical protein